MATRLIPSSFQCDCGHVSHFFERTVREIESDSGRRGKSVRIADSERDEHAIEFSNGRAVAVICPSICRGFANCSKSTTPGENRRWLVLGERAAKQAVELARQGEEAVDAYEKISGFKQSIQEEILRKSGGDFSKLDDLVEEAQEGAFDVRRCGGAHGCEIIRDIIAGEVTQVKFQELVKDVADNLQTEIPKSALRSAARQFWKALAQG